MVLTHSEICNISPQFTAPCHCSINQLLLVVFLITNQYIFKEHKGPVCHCVYMCRFTLIQLKTQSCQSGTGLREKTFLEQIEGSKTVKSQAALKLARHGAKQNIQSEEVERCTLCSEQP